MRYRLYWQCGFLEQKRYPTNNNYIDEVDRIAFSIEEDEFEITQCGSHYSEKLKKTYSRTTTMKVFIKNPFRNLPYHWRHT